MLARVTSGASGIKEYLEKGIKADRFLSRDELDHRVCIEGDINLTDEIIKDLQDKNRKENYFHITLSFSEKDISEEQITKAYQDYMSLVFDAYKKEEFNVYAEIHFPKIKSYTDNKTGDLVERYPHVHIVVPQKNLMSGLALNPFGKYSDIVEYHDAIQEGINQKHGLSSPYDNPRPYNKMLNKSDFISRYKGDDFKGAGSDFKRSVLNDIHNGTINNSDELRAALSKHGQVELAQSKIHGSYLKVKPEGSKKFIRMKDDCFKDFYLSNKRKEISKPTKKEINAKINEWRSVISKEIKYIRRASPKDRKNYYALDREGRGRFLSEAVRQYEDKYNPTPKIKVERDDFSTKPNKPKSLSDVPNEVSGLPSKSLVPNARDARNTAPGENRGLDNTNHTEWSQTNHKGGESKYEKDDLRKGRREASSKLGSEPDGSGGFTERTDGLPSMPPRDLVSAKREGKQTSRSKGLLSSDASDYLGARQPNGYSQLRRANDIGGGRRGRGYGDARDSLSATRLSSGHRIWGDTQRLPRSWRGLRRLPRSLSPEKGFVGQKGKAPTYIKNLSVAQQILRDYRESKSKVAESEVLESARQNIDPNLVLDHLAETKGLVKDNYRTYRTKAGARISTGTKTYTVIDFYQKHMHLGWDETKDSINKIYRSQVQSEVDRNQINSIVAAIDTLHRQGGRRTRQTLNDTIRIYRKLQKQELEGMRKMEKQSNTSPLTDDRAGENSIELDKLSAKAVKNNFHRQMAMQHRLNNEAVLDKFVLSRDYDTQSVNFTDKESGKVKFVESQDGIYMKDKKPDFDTTAAAMTLAAEKYGVVSIKGTAEFKQQAIDVAIAKNLDIVFGDKKMHDIFIQQKNEYKDTIKNQRDGNLEPLSDKDLLKNAQEQAKQKGELPVVLVRHGEANYLHDDKNSKSYFAELSNGETVWGKGLKQAFKDSQAEVGDEIKIKNNGSETVTVPVKETDPVTKLTSVVKKQIERNIFVIDVVTTKKELEAEALKAEAPKGEAPKAEAPKGEVPKGEAPKAEAPKGEVPKGEVPKAEVPKGEAPKAEAPKGEVPKADEVNTYKVDYKYDKATNQNIVTINGKPPYNVDKNTLEKIANSDPYLKKYGFEEIKNGKLDVSKSGMVQAIPKTYDNSGKPVIEAPKQATTNKVKL
jgi:hypothetical protein